MKTAVSSEAHIFKTIYEYTYISKVDYPLKLQNDHLADQKVVEWMLFDKGNTDKKKTWLYLECQPGI